MKYLLQTAEKDEELNKQLNYERVLLDTTDSSIYIINPSSGYNLIDLGLTSGTLWCDRNVEAENINDVGLYFAWGDINGYTASQIGYNKTFGWDNYIYANGSQTSLTKYCSKASYGYNGYTDTLTTLQEIDEPVQKYTEHLLLPTREQIKELIMETDVYLIKADGTEVHGTLNDEKVYWDETVGSNENLNGCEFRKKSNNNIKIFFPVSGGAIYSELYNGKLMGISWSCTLTENYPVNAYFLYFFNECCFCDDIDKCYGSPIRGVYKP